jgi:hypothetical protein
VEQFALNHHVLLEAAEYNDELPGVKKILHQKNSSDDQGLQFSLKLGGSL